MSGACAGCGEAGGELIVIGDARALYHARCATIKRRLFEISGITAEDFTGDAERWPRMGREEREDLLHRLYEESARTETAAGEQAEILDDLIDAIERDEIGQIRRAS